MRINNKYDLMPENKESVNIVIIYSYVFAIFNK